MYILVIFCEKLCIITQKIFNYISLFLPIIYLKIKK